MDTACPTVEASKCGAGVAHIDGVYVVLTPGEISSAFWGKDQWHFRSEFSETTAAPTAYTIRRVVPDSEMADWRDVIRKVPRDRLLCAFCVPRTVPPVWVFEKPILLRCRHTDTCNASTAPLGPDAVESPSGAAVYALPADVDLRQPPGSPFIGAVRIAPRPSLLMRGLRWLLRRK
jgi:hypothetical protein